MTNHLYMLIESMDREWSGWNIYERKDARRALVNQLYRYQKLFPLWDDFTTVEGECCYYVLEHLVLIFDSPFITYHNWFDEHYEAAIETIHCYYPPFTEGEIHFNVTGKKKYAYLLKATAAGAVAFFYTMFSSFISIG